MKTVAIPVIPKTLCDDAENWVHGSRDRNETSAAPRPETSPGPMKRFTIDVSLELHKRIKTQCAMRGAKMADVLREILEREFPKS
jgi:ParG